MSECEKLQRIVNAALEMPDATTARVTYGIMNTALNMPGVMCAALNRPLDAYCQWWVERNITMNPLHATIAWDYARNYVPVNGQ